MVDDFRPSTSTASTSRCDSYEEVFVREATTEDEQEIIELSTCIYKQHDWLATNFLKVLQKEKNHIFVALVEGHIAGCVMCCVVDSDTTLVMWGMRIHPQYRRRNISHFLREAVFNVARDKYPSVEYERFSAIAENKHVERLRVKLGFKKVMEFKAFNVLISDEVRKLLRKILYETLSKNHHLKKISNEDALNLIGVQKQNNYLLPTHTMIMEYVPYELTSSNAHAIFEENDVILVNKDLTRPSRSDRLRSFVPGLKPSAVSSLSHGRAVQRVQSIHWETALYSYKAESFRDHLVFQLKEALEATKDQFVFTCLHADYNAEIVWEVLIQELCLRQLEDKQQLTKVVIYERPVRGDGQVFTSL